MKLSSLLSTDRFAGLDLDTNPLRAALREDGRLPASVARNVYIDQQSGEVRKTPGRRLFHSAIPGGAPPILGLYEHQTNTGNRYLLCRTRTGYYLSNSQRTAWTLLHAEPLHDACFNAPSWASLGNYLVIVDGERAFLWDGIESELTPWRSGGIEAPKSRSLSLKNQRPALTQTAGSTFPGGQAFEFFLTFYNSVTGAESPPGYILHRGGSGAQAKNVKIWTGYAKVGAGQTADGKLGSGHGWWPVPAGVTHIRVYRSDADTPGIWYRVADASGGLTAVAADDAGDEITIDITSLTKASESALSGFIGPPVGVNVCVNHAQRIFVCGSPQFPNRLWWTAAGEFNFAATQFIEVGKPGDPIVGLCSFPLETPTLGIFCRNSVWGLAGYDEATFAAGLRQKADGPGSAAPHAIAIVNGIAYFWGSEGWFSFDGDTVAPIDRGVRTHLLNTVRGLV